MNRRGFLRAFGGAIGGLTVSGPRSLGAEAARTMALAAPGFESPLGAPPSSDTKWAVKALARLTAGITRADFARKTVVMRLDPDLAAMNSMSLSARMTIQKERDVARRLDDERTFLEREISGFWN